MANAAPGNGHRTPQQVLDPQLSFLASKAAIEIDNLILGNPSEGSAIRDLAEALSQPTLHVPESPAQVRLADPVAFDVLSRAVSEVSAQPVRTIEALVAEARSLTSSLQDTKRANAEVLEKARDFCLALSRAARTTNQALSAHSRPRHPFRT